MLLKEVWDLVPKQAEMGLVNLCKCRTGLNHPVLLLSAGTRARGAALHGLHSSTRLSRDLTGLWGSLRVLGPQHRKPPRGAL